MKKLLTISILLMFLFAINTRSQENSESMHPGVHLIVLLEVIQTTSYTYLFVSQEQDSLWIAIPRMEVSTGDTYYYHGGMEMRDFKSKELDRTFRSILFLNGIVHPDIVEGKEAADEKQEVPVKKKEEPEIINIQPVDGVTSISELFTNKKKHEGKNIKIQGKVVKYNSGIMGKNWIHLDDGSCKSGKCDLTVTTDDETKIGDIIIVEGKIILDKDFGAGYYYTLIMEGAKILR